MNLPTSTGTADDLPLPSRVLVAGAGGVLGRWIVHELVRRGVRVRAVVRRSRSADFFSPDAVECRCLDGRRPGGWSGACDEVEVVISCLGAPVNPSPFVGWRPYTAVDAPANLSLLAEARRAGVRRFIYVSLLDGDASRELNYAEGHERVVDALRRSNLPATILRPTGFFAAMAELVKFARYGVVPVIGDGMCRTNPIHERDVAFAAAEAVRDGGDVFREMALGGPEEFTRREIAALAFDVLGKRPRLPRLPSVLVRTGAHAIRLVNPRAGHFALFAAHIMTHPCIGPKVGTHRLEAYFRACAGTSAPIVES